MSDIWVYLALGAIVAVGALVQTVVGFGMAVIAAPAVIVLAPDLMPAALLTTSFALPMWELVRGDREIAWRLFGFAIAGRIALLPVGVWLVASASPNAIAAVIGVMVLVAVAASMAAPPLPATAGSALGSGVLTGISGTAASIGGPFLGLVLQHERPAVVRSTLAMFFVVGASTSLLGLAVAGQVRGGQLLAGVGWIPFVALGAAAAQPLRDAVDRDSMRRGVLAVAGLAGVLVLLRAVFA